MSNSFDRVNANSHSGAVPVFPASAIEHFGAPRARFDLDWFRARREHRKEIDEANRFIDSLMMPSERQFCRPRQRSNAFPVGDSRNMLTDRALRLRERGQSLKDQLLRDLYVPNGTDHDLNTVLTAGKNDLLDKYFAGSSYTAAWYCGLISSVSYSAINAADTMASHAGWTEAGATNAPNYSSGTRVALAFASASGGSKATSSASSFTFSSGGTIKGMFGATNSTKDGTTGLAYNAVTFTGGDRIVASSDVVNVSVTYSA